MEFGYAIVAKFNFLFKLYFKSGNLLLLMINSLVKKDLSKTVSLILFMDKLATILYGWPFLKKHLPRLLVHTYA